MGEMGVRFMSAFNEIEEYLRRSLNEPEHVEFAHLARRFADRQRLTRAQRDALSAFSSLRNAIAHGRYFDGHSIADPVPDVVEDIERLRGLIMRPPTAMGAVSRETVRIVRPESPLVSALELVRAFDYSQLPVYDKGRNVGLLTTNAIARWLAEQLGGEVGLAEGVPISEVMQYAEPQDQGLSVIT